MEVSGQLHAMIALPPEKERPLYPLHWRLVGPQNRSGHIGEEEKSHYYPYRESNPGRPIRRVPYLSTFILRNVVFLLSNLKISSFAVLTNSFNEF
jgi:hypothetical protein